MPEVLAPAGDRERMEAALRYGADAVYLGGKQHSMRASTPSFDMEQLKSAVEYAHGMGRRVYFTLNITPRSDEIDSIMSYIADVAATGVDAIIVADIGIMLAVKRIAPDVEVHISTQAGVTNYLTALELHAMGASRVVLARELSLEDIAEIRAKTPSSLELEVFVHGSMCMAFSGRCLISQYMNGRDANHGECSQPCRWKYSLVEEKRPGVTMPIFEDDGGTYIMNAKDMCLIEDLDKLIAAGASSLKIEGRAKSAYYVAAITNAYRTAVDIYLKNPSDYKVPDWILEEVRKVSHRDYTKGFLYGQPDEGQCYETAGYIRMWDIVGVAKSCEAGRITLGQKNRFFEGDFLYGQPDEGQCYETAGYIRMWDIVGVAKSCEAGRITLGQKNRFFEGDTLELLAPGEKPMTVKVEDLRDADGESIDAARRAEMVCSFKLGFSVPEGTVIRKEVAEG